MTITVMITLDLKPEFAADLHQIINEVVGETAEFEGFESISYHQDMEDPTNFIVWEQWESRAAWDKYLAWRHSTTMFNDVEHMMNGPSTTTYLTEVKTKLSA